MANSLSETVPPPKTPPSQLQQAQDFQFPFLIKNEEMVIDEVSDLMIAAHPETSFPVPFIPLEVPEDPFLSGIDRIDFAYEHEAVNPVESHLMSDLHRNTENLFGDVYPFEETMTEQELFLASIEFANEAESTSGVIAHVDDPTSLLPLQLPAERPTTPTFEEFLNQDLHASSFSTVHGDIQPLKEASPPSESIDQSHDLNTPTVDIPHPSNYESPASDDSSGKYAHNIPLLDTPSFLNNHDMPFYTGSVLGMNATLGALTPLDHDEKDFHAIDESLGMENITFGAIAGVHCHSEVTQSSDQSDQWTIFPFEGANWLIENGIDTEPMELSGNIVNWDQITSKNLDSIHSPEDGSNETASITHFTDWQPDANPESMVIAPYDTSKNKYTTYYLTSANDVQRILPHYNDVAGREPKWNEDVVEENIQPAEEQPTQKRPKLKIVIHVRDDDPPESSSSGESSPHQILAPAVQSDSDDEYDPRPLRQRPTPVRNTRVSGRRRVRFRHDASPSTSPVVRGGRRSLIVKLRLPSAGTVANFRLGTTGSSFTSTFGLVNSTTFVDIPARLHVDDFPNKEAGTNVRHFSRSTFVIKLKFLGRPEPTTIALDRYWRIYANQDDTKTILMSKSAKAAPKYITFHGSFQVIRLRKCGYCKKLGIKCDSRGPCGPCAEYHAKYPTLKKQYCTPIEVALHESDFKALGMGNPDSVLHNAAMPPWGQAVVGHGRLQLVTDFISTRVASQKGMWRAKDKSVNSSKIVILDHSPTEEERKRFAYNNLESYDDVGDAEALADEEESEAETGAQQHNKEQEDVTMSGVNLLSTEADKRYDDSDNNDYVDDTSGA